ncbi:MAG: HNH endonuclease [Gammaproteobacteria bacterium]|nr:HNH endonuclease [Gammaproteobacteria bacterium]
MAKNNRWTEQQLLVAFALYCRIPFGLFHQRNPELIRYAELIGRTPSALAMKLCNIASLDPVFIQSGRKGLEGASQADQRMWDSMQQDWEGFALRSQAALDDLGVIEIEPLEKDGPDTDFSAEDAIVRRKQRIGQNLFRQAVLSAYDYRCCISGLAVPELLVASHIVPWSQDKKNRLNPRNGLALSVLHDKAFDLGYLTLDKDYRVVISHLLDNSEDSFLQDSLWRYDGCQIRLPSKFWPQPDFLEFHRENILRT